MPDKAIVVSVWFRMICIKVKLTVLVDLERSVVRVALKHAQL